MNSPNNAFYPPRRTALDPSAPSYQTSLQPSDPTDTFLEGATSVDHVSRPVRAGLRSANIYLPEDFEEWVDAPNLRRSRPNYTNRQPQQQTHIPQTNHHGSQPYSQENPSGFTRRIRRTWRQYDTSVPDQAHINMSDRRSISPQNQQEPRRLTPGSGNELDGRRLIPPTIQPLFDRLSEGDHRLFRDMSHAAILSDNRTIQDALPNQPPPQPPLHRMSLRIRPKSVGCMIC